MQNVLRTLVVLIILIPITGQCCEPILPLFQLLSGSTLAGSALTKSFWWLAIAVAIKCAAFIFLEKQLPWGKALAFMVIANVLSTVPGFLVATLTASLAGFFLAIPIILFLAWIVQRRFRLLPESKLRDRFSAGAAGLAFLVFFFVSLLLFAIAGGALESRNITSYWIFKFFFVTLAACTGMIISAVLEECAIARLARKAHGNLSFFHSVFRANYITLGAVLLVVAVQMIPRRLGASNFIVSWLTSLSNTLGLS